MNITRIWFDNNRIYGETEDNQVLWQSLLWYRRLMNASEIQRQDYEIDDEGIHWEKLDEDVSFESFEYEDREPKGISLLFLSHPELNPSEIAKRVGISRNLMTMFVNGTKKPSPDLEKSIMNEVKNVGMELESVC